MELVENFCSNSEEEMEKCVAQLAATSSSLQVSPPLPVTPSGLLRLPFEIRLRIHHYCIPRKRIIEVSLPRFNTRWDDDVALDFDSDFWDPNENKNSIFLLSKQVSQEALDVLYGDNIFKLYLNGQGEVYFRKNFAEANRRRMRYLLLIALPSGVSFREQIPDKALWSSVLLTLKVLRVVAEQPIKARSYYNAPTLKQEMDGWVKFIKPYLQFFGQHVLGETVIKIDDDGREVTRELVKGFLPNGYREVRCHLAGDLIFKRARFSILGRLQRGS